MSHASLILGYLFSREELVNSATLKVLTPEILKLYLRRNTKHLDLEWYSERQIIPNTNLRTGYNAVRRTFDKSDFLNKQRFLVGTCLADLDDFAEVLLVRDTTKTVDKSLVDQVLGEFEEVFPKRNWAAGDLSEILVSAMYARSITGGRADYPIITPPS